MSTENKSILIIDDDIDLLELLSEYLKGEGFTCACASDGAEGLRKALEEKYDLAILDVMLPLQNGFEVLTNLRSAQSMLPVIMLTAKGEETDKIVGLELGADDYLQKPFNPRELLARIRAILRRVSATKGQAVKEKRIVIDDLEMWPSSMRAAINGTEINLTALEFRLLERLTDEFGKVLDRELLYKAILGHYSNPFERSLDMHISRLRKKLGPRKDGGDRIKAIRGEGYMFLS